MCALIYESLVVSSRIIVDARGAWRLGYCDVSRVTHKTPLLRRSNRLWRHVVYTCLSVENANTLFTVPLLNFVWHYKHVCVSAYTWRLKLEATFDWHHIYQKGDGANAKQERCRHLYDQQITVGQGIFCGLPELDLAVSECQPAIQIVRHV